MFSNKKEENQSHERNQESSLFGKGSTFTGTVDSSENVRVDGKIVGEVNTKAKIVAGTDSNIEGNIHAERAEISGLVKGDIFVTDILILRASAKINGNIFTDKLIMDQGASLNGKCKVGDQVNKLLMLKDQDKQKVNGKKTDSDKEYMSAAG